eukprot:249669-Chlamydomonas_euryale.AAC.1
MATVNYLPATFQPPTSHLSASHCRHAPCPYALEAVHTVVQSAVQGGPDSAAMHTGGVWDHPSLDPEARVAPPFPGVFP